MIYLYLFGTCFHFIYVFMIIDKYYSGEAILIQTNDGELNFGIVYYGYGYNGNMYYTVTCIDKTYTMDEIIRWAYVKDLTPDMED